MECKCIEREKPNVEEVIGDGLASSATDEVKVRVPERRLSVARIAKLGRQASMALDGGELVNDDVEASQAVRDFENLGDKTENIQKEIQSSEPELNKVGVGDSPASGTSQGLMVAMRRVSRRISEMLVFQQMSGKQTPDFTGVWKMVKYDGDFQEFMKEMGVGWALRKAANAVGYGVNATYHTIEMTPERIKVTTKNPKGIFVKDYTIDASEQDDVDPVTKEPIKVVPTWAWEEGNSIAILKVEAYKPSKNEGKKEMPLTRRYLEGPIMIMEQTSPNGITVRRLFEKQ